MKKAIFAVMVCIATAQAFAAVSVGGNAKNTMQSAYARMAMIDAATR